MARNEKRKRVIDLFAGIGGLSSGFEDSNDFEIIAYEGDRRIAAQLAKRVKTHHTVLNGENVKTIGPCDVLLGGPPCQPFSRTGSQRGNEDERDHIPTFLAGIRHCQPQAFVMENVENLATRHRHVLNALINGATDLGYAVTCRILDASFYGVPQKRRRLFVVGTRGFVYQWPQPDASKCLVRDVIREDDCLRVWTDDLEIGSTWKARIHEYEKKSKSRPRILYFDEPCRTITTKNLRGKTNDVMRIRDRQKGERTLTLAEACALQTVPPFWLDGCDERLVCKMIGNSVPPQLARRVIASLIACMPN